MNIQETTHKGCPNMSNPPKQPLRPTNERRKEARFTTYLESILEQEEFNIYTTVINLSERGAGFLSAKPFKKGDIVNINLSFRSPNVNPIKLKVHVLSCQEVDLEYYIGGIIISKTDEFKKFYETIPQDNQQPVQ